MIDKLILMYEKGAITGYQLMMDSYQILDPEDPDIILGQLPDSVHEMMLAYAQRYDARRPHSATFPPPAEELVRAAERWIHARQARNSEPIIR